MREHRGCVNPRTVNGNVGTPRLSGRCETQGGVGPGIVTGSWGRGDGIAVGCNGGVGIMAVCFSRRIGTTGCASCVGVVGICNGGGGVSTGCESHGGDDCGRGKGGTGVNTQQWATGMTRRCEESRRVNSLFANTLVTSNVQPNATDHKMNT